MNPFDPEDDTPAAPHWGSGGYSLRVTAEDELVLSNMLSTVSSGCTRPAARQIARYARGLDLFRERGGPHEAVAVGRALGVKADSIHYLFNPRRLKWNARALRRKLVVANMPRNVEGIVLGLALSDDNRKPYAIMTAHAFGAGWRILVAVDRVELNRDDADTYSHEAPRARQRVIDEVTQLLTVMHLDHQIPLLTGDTTIALHLLEYLIESDQLMFLTEVEATWAYGGIVPIGDIDSPRMPMAAGGTIRELFPGPSDPVEDVRVRSILLTAYTQLIGPVAIAVGPFGRERFFIGRAHGRAGADLQAQAATHKAAELARKFGRRDFTGVADGYGLAKFRCLGPDRFQRHCTALTLRDCFAAKSLTINEHE